MVASGIKYGEGTEVTRHDRPGAGNAGGILPRVYRDGVCLGKEWRGEQSAADVALSTQEVGDGRPKSDNL
jgi:hypothetical protein